MIWTLILAEIPFIVAGNHRMSPHASQLIDGKQGSTASKETYPQSPLSLGPQCVMLSQRCHKLRFAVWLVFMFSFSFLFFFSVLGMEHRVLSAPGKHSTIEPHSQALMGAGVGWALDRDRDLTIEPHYPVLILFLGHSGTGKTTETEDMFMTNWGWDRKKANKTV